MNGPPGDYMTLGILQPAAFPDATVPTLREIAGSLGFVETSVPTPCPEILVDYDAGSLLYASTASLCSLDPAERAHALRICQDVIAAAQLIGAERVSLISGQDPGPADRSAAMDALVDSILTLYESAPPLELSLKMADRAVDKRFLIGPTCDGIEVAQRVGEHHPNFGLIPNLAHLPLLAEDPTTAVRLAAPYIARVHIGNCIPSEGDTHPPFGVPNSAVGLPELTSFLRALVEVGYLSPTNRGVVAFEIRPPATSDPWHVIADARHVLSQAWAGV